MISRLFINWSHLEHSGSCLDSRKSSAVGTCILHWEPVDNAVLREFWTADRLGVAARDLPSFPSRFIPPAALSPSLRSQRLPLTRLPLLTEDEVQYLSTECWWCSGDVPVTVTRAEQDPSCRPTSECRQCRDALYNWMSSSFIDWFCIIVSFNWNAATVLKQSQALGLNFHIITARVSTRWRRHTGYPLLLATAVHTVRERTFLPLQIELRKVFDRVKIEFGFCPHNRGREDKLLKLRHPPHRHGRRVRGMELPLVCPSQIMLLFVFQSIGAVWSLPSCRWAVILWNGKGTYVPAVLFTVGCGGESDSNVICSHLTCLCRVSFPLIF